jgi:hypothetical protein
LLNGLIGRKAGIATYNATIGGIAKDLSIYFFNISQVDVSTTLPVQLAVGEIHDPKRSKDPKNKAELNSKMLGLQVTFALNAVNEVSTSVTSVPGPSARKAIATITVLYADPIFEVSAGAFFSTLPNRSFANQTLVTQNPGASPTPGNIVISQTITRPTIVPFAGANFRLAPAFTWFGRRRGAFYLTGAMGANTYNSTAEFGLGPSVSWRSDYVQRALPHRTRYPPDAGRTGRRSMVQFYGGNRHCAEMQRQPAVAYVREILDRRFRVRRQRQNTVCFFSLRALIRAHLECVTSWIVGPLS